MYSRVVDGRTLTFGVSGKLWKNALVMYDRQTRSLWSHLTGACIDGVYEGARLEMLSATPIVRWKVWRRAHPDTKVLSIGGREDQRRDSYRDYHRSSRTGLIPTEHRDDRFGEKDLVIGVALSGHRKAYPTEDDLWKVDVDGKVRVIEDTIGPVPVLVYHDPENFTSAVYHRRVGDRVVRFKPTADGIVAEDTEGRRWNLLTGAGPDGLRLEPIPHLNVYWFAWVDFYPDAAVYEEKGP